MRTLASRAMIRWPSTSFSDPSAISTKCRNSLRVERVHPSARLAATDVAARIT